MMDMFYNCLSYYIRVSLFINDVYIFGKAMGMSQSLHFPVLNITNRSWMESAIHVFVTPLPVMSISTIYIYLVSCHNFA